jgi:hypothetical protein
MGVVKLTSSKKGVQFITDDGVVYQTSVLWLVKLLEEGNAHRVLLLSRFPGRVASNRFKESPVFYANGVVSDEVKQDNNEVPSQGSDAFSHKAAKEREVSKSYVDKVVW